jgi:MFS family permease
MKGPTLTSGLFQDFYQTEYLSDYTPSAIGWIGAINAFFLVVTGVIAGPLFDRGFLRVLMALGCFMSVFGMMMLSLSTQYYQIFLSQGVCMGIGNGLVYVPALAMVGRLFAEQRAYAIGTVTTGASIGKWSADRRVFCC